MKTVVHIKYSYLPLSETFIYQIIKSLSKYRAMVVSLEQKNFEFFPYSDVYFPVTFREKALNIVIQKATRILPFPYRYTPFYDKIVKKFHPVLIHAHFGMEGVQSLFLKNKYKIALITSFYGHDLSVYPRKKYWRKAYKQLFGEGNVFLIEGNNMKSRLLDLGCSEEKIIIQHIGVDLEKLKYKKRIVNEGEKIKILFCGRLVEKKGLEYALVALGKIVDKYKNVQLRIIGDGPLKKKMETLSNNLKLRDYVIFLGSCNYEKYIKELEDAHIFIAPSLTASNGDTEGGAPTTLLEAQAVGLPVLATKHADIPGVVKEGESGFLVPEGDVKSLTEKLDYLIEYPEIWTGMGEMGRQHIAENHNIKTEIKKLESIYDRTVNSYNEK